MRPVSRRKPVGLIGGSVPSPDRGDGTLTGTEQGQRRSLRPRIRELLACPTCGGDLTLVSDAAQEPASGASFWCEECNVGFPIVNAIPRFVGSANYASNFGFQWNAFRATQLDSHSGVPISRTRFVEQSGWTNSDLAGKLVLDIGCGAGRFAEIALDFGAEVVAVDYSSAVEACLENLGSNERLSVIQADLYRLPFKPESFDFVYCFGVLQHTPNVETAFKSIPGVLKAGGGLAVDVYPKLFRTLFDTHYWIRPLTKRLNGATLFQAVQRAVPIMLPLSRVLGRIPILGRWLHHAVPVSNYEGRYPLNNSQLKEWAVLDTFDMLAPAHDQPQTRKTVKRWFQESGLIRIEVFRLRQWVGRGQKLPLPAVHWSPETNPPLVTDPSDGSHERYGRFATLWRSKAARRLKQRNES